MSVKQVLILLTVLLFQDSFIFSESDFEHPIVVVVCSYRNGEWAKKNLDSIFSQNYQNFRLIYVDDGSPDNNAQVVKDYIKDNGLEDRVTLICNKKRLRKLSNWYKVLYMCNDDEIVLLVDGDDWLAHPNVFAYINKKYEDPGVWLTYGQYKNVPASEAGRWGFREHGYCKQIPSYIVKRRAYRRYPFIYMHPRSFRASLFKLVKLEDLIAENIAGYVGDYYPASNDNAVFFPMIEMAHSHILFIPAILYIRNLYSDIVGFKVDRAIQVASQREIRKKTLYPILRALKKNRLERYNHAQADMIIVCKNDLSKIDELLQNIYNTLENIGTIYLFYKGTAENKASCQSIKKSQNKVVFVSCDETGKVSLKNILLNIVYNIQNKHVIVSSDQIKIIKKTNISDLIYWLERTYAYSFYLNRNSHSDYMRSFVELDDDICAWKFLSNRSKAYDDDMILYHTTTLSQQLVGSSFSTVDEFVRTRSSTLLPHGKVGLFFKKKRVMPID